MSTEKKEYVIRREGTAGRYGLGEVVSDRVVLFKDGFWNLTEDQLKAKLSNKTIVLANIE